MTGGTPLIVVCHGVPVMDNFNPIYLIQKLFSIFRWRNANFFFEKS
jgi:hypothetical protein